MIKMILVWEMKIPYFFIFKIIKNLKNIDTKLSPESLQRNNLISNDNKKSPVLCVSARRIKINQHMKITAKNKDLNPSSTKKFSMQKNNSNDTLSLSYQIFNKTKQGYEKQTSLGKKDIKTNKAKRKRRKRKRKKIKRRKRKKRKRRKRRKR